MKLVTDFIVHKNAPKKSRRFVIRKLLNDIKGFVRMGNCAFWGREDGGPANCIVVEGFAGGLNYGEVIDRRDIEKEILGWCEALEAYCRVDADQQEYASYKHLRVEVEDRMLGGGFGVVCYDMNNRRDHEIHILPLTTDVLGIKGNHNEA